MNIIKLISELTEILSRDGDLPVSGCCNHDEGGSIVFDINSVEVDMESIESKKLYVSLNED